MHDSSKTTTEFSSKFLSLSLYALGASELQGSLSWGWLAHPVHIVFDGAPKAFNRARPDALMYRKLRDLTTEEEQMVAEWFLRGKSGVTDTQG